MTVGSNSVCGLVQGFPILLILAQKFNRCLETPLIYKPPSPTPSPEYYEALDALLHSLSLNKDDCDHNYGDKPYYIYGKKPFYGYSGHGYGYQRYSGYSGNPSPCYGSDHGMHGYGYPIHVYKKGNIYNITGIKYGNKGYAPGNQYNINHRKIKVVVRRPKSAKRKLQKLQVTPCKTFDGENGTCLEETLCFHIENITEHIKDDVCLSEGIEGLICCPVASVSYAPELTEDYDEPTGSEARRTVEHSTEVNGNLELIENIKSEAKHDRNPKKLSINEVIVKLGDLIPRPPTCGVSQGNKTSVISAESSRSPWLSLLGYKDPNDITEWNCTGSLITSRHVVTAAKCIHGFEEILYLVRIGEDLAKKDAQAIDVPIKNKVPHLLYNKTINVNDIGILTLEREVKYSEFIKPICLPIESKLRRIGFIKKHSFISTRKISQAGPPSTRLLFTRVQIVSNNKCSKVFNDSIIIDKRVLCTGINGWHNNTDSYHNDSGGPLMMPVRINGTSYFYIIGVASYPDKCSKTGLPLVFSKVTKFLPWILRVILSDNDKIN